MNQPSGIVRRLSQKSRKRLHNAPKDFFAQNKQLKLSAQNERARWTEIQTWRKSALRRWGDARRRQSTFGAALNDACSRESAADEKRGA